MLAGALGIASVAVAPLPASAGPDDPIQVTAGGNVLTITITLPSTNGTGPTGGGPGYEEGISLDPCTYGSDTTGAGITTWNGTNDPPLASDVAAGKIVFVYTSCPGQQPTTQWYFGNPPTLPKPPTPGQLGAVARKHIPLPSPKVKLNPNVGLVNFPEWFAVDQSSWGIVNGSLSLRGTSVVVTAQAYRSDWTTGDGATVPCNGPGIQWDSSMTSTTSSYCKYVYTKSSAGQPVNAQGNPAYQGTVTTYWRVSYVGAMPGGPQETGTLPDLLITSNFTAPIQERQAIVKLNNG